MVELKYGKYIISDPKVVDQLVHHDKEEAYQWKLPAETYLGGDMVPGCPVWLDINWIFDTHLPQEPSWVEPHKHDQLEILLFVATNPKGELGGEVEFNIGGEKHTFDHTTAIYVPPGVEHCPIVYRTFNKDMPQMMMALLFNPEYV